MAWTVEFTEGARRDLRTIGHVERRRVLQFLRERAALRDDPRELAQKLRDTELDVWRFRVGNYRILVQFEDHIMTILVIAVGHRREVYR